MLFLLKEIVAGDNPPFLVSVSLPVSWQFVTGIGKHLSLDAVTLATLFGVPDVARVCGNPRPKG